MSNSSEVGYLIFNFQNPTSYKIDLYFKYSAKRQLNDEFK